MGISIYSVVISTVFFNIALIAAFIMRRSSVLLAKRTVSFLLLTVLLGVVRLLTPIDFDKAIVVRSYQVIPAIEDFFSSSVAGSITYGSLLLVIWLVGTIALLTRDLAKQILFVRTIRSYPVSDRKDLLDLASEFGNDFGLLVSPSISRPYVSGLFRPVIYLPDIELSETQWRIILSHEVQHIRSHDGWKKLFFLAIQALFWWNPLAHISRGEIDTLLELQCDAKVTANMSAEEVDTYLEMLKSLSSQAHEHRTPIEAYALVWDQGQLITRFQALQNAGYSTKKHPHYIAYIVLFAVFVMSYFVIVQPFGYASGEDFLEDVALPDDYEVWDVTGEMSNMYILYSDGKYYLYMGDDCLNLIEEENLSNAPFNSIPIIGGNK